MSKTKIEIKTFGGTLLFSHEVENNTIIKTVEEAVTKRKDLTGAYLRGAYLTGAYLRGADLTGADLRGAYLTGADLTGADLTGAYLTGAYLRGADLTGADLTGADLRGAYLRGAYLRGAYLTGADLTGAYLRGADLTGAYLRGAYLTGADLKKLPTEWINSCSRDILFVFEHLKNELPFLRERLLKGEVDGTCYEGECACLIGTLANADGGIEKVCAAIPFYTKGTHNPCEAFFWHIKKGDTPKTNQFAKHALMLIDSVLGTTPTKKITKKKLSTKK